jgi:hypothetical protein
MKMKNKLAVTRHNFSYKVSAQHWQENINLIIFSIIGLKIYGSEKKYISLSMTRINHKFNKKIK